MSRAKLFEEIRRERRGEKRRAALLRITPGMVHGHHPLLEARTPMRCSLDAAVGAGHRKSARPADLVRERTGTPVHIGPRHIAMERVRTADGFRGCR